MRQFYLIMFFVVSLFVEGVAAGAVFGDRQKSEIKGALADLRAADIQVEKGLADEEKTRCDLETKILGRSGRRSLKDKMAMDKDQVLAYRAVGLNDVSYLRDNWAHLTQDDKDLVKESKMDLLN